LAVPSVGALRETGDSWEPYRLVDAAGELVVAVAEFFRDLQAAGRPEATLRSYLLVEYLRERQPAVDCDLHLALLEIQETRPRARARVCCCRVASAPRRLARRSRSRSAAG